MRAAATVVLASPGGEFVVVRPGEPFPEWAEVTNPDAIVGGVAEADAGKDAPADEDKPTDEGESPDEDKPADEADPADKPAPAKRTTRATKPAPTE